MVKHLTTYLVLSSQLFPCSQSPCNAISGRCRGSGSLYRSSRTFRFETGRRTFSFRNSDVSDLFRLVNMESKRFVAILTSFSARRCRFEWRMKDFATLITSRKVYSASGKRLRTASCRTCTPSVCAIEKSNASSILQIGEAQFVKVALLSSGDVYAQKDSSNRQKTDRFESLFVTSTFSSRCAISSV